MRLTIFGGELGQTVGQSGSAVVAPANTSENILATVTLPALSANARVEISSVWTFTNNANSKTMRVRLNGAAGTVYMSAVGFTTQLSIQAETNIQNRGATNSQVGGSPVIATGAGTIFVTAPTTSSVDTSAPVTLVFTAEKATAGDTVTLESYAVKVYP